VDGQVAGSFRDPSGFLFRKAGVLYRQINQCYQQDYKQLIDSRLHRDLVDSGFLVSHQPTDLEPLTEQGFLVVQPEPITSISYPYEWCFSQLKDAALLTLEIQSLAIAKNMSLKDASAYNVQFHNGKPIFIDTLSFESYEEGAPWMAYQQFCRHFLAPLALMSLTDIRMGQILRTNIAGIPLDMASKLLPFRTKLGISLGIHIHLHARAQRKSAARGVIKKQRKGSFSKTAFLALINSLQSAINRLNWEPTGTEWHDYYLGNNNYSNSSLDYKDSVIKEFVQRVGPELVWDMGANTGRYSRIAASVSKLVCSWDIDPACVEINYRNVVEHNEKRILPLLLDLANPSPAIGWGNEERLSLKERGGVDMVLALGLVHHLVIANNTPMAKLADYFSDIGRSVIVEFVPKSDSQVKKLLASRIDIFTEYDQAHFEEIFARHFEIEDCRHIPDTERRLYLLTRKHDRTPLG